MTLAIVSSTGKRVRRDNEQTWPRESSRHGRRIAVTDQDRSPKAAGDERAALLRRTAERAILYLDTLDTRTVAPSPAAIAHLAALREPLPERPTDPDAV